MKFFSKIKSGDSFCFFVLLSILSAAFLLVYISLTRNIPEKYPDIIMEMNAFVSGNKSAEMFFIYFLSFFGISAYTLFYIFTKNNLKKENEEKKSNFPLYSVILIGIVLLIQTFCIKYNSNYNYFIIFLYSILCYFKNKEHFFDYIVLFFFNLYFIYACNSIYIFMSPNETMLTSSIALWTTFIISSAILFINKKELFGRIILTEQLFLPFLFLIYLQKSYLYDEQTILLNSTVPVRIFISLLIISILIEAVLLVKNYFKNGISDLNKILAYGSCIAIWGFNLFKTKINIASDDLRHPFENIICFHQIFQMNQIPYKEFIPVSGFYSTVHGAILQFFGNGTVTQYYMSENILFLIFAVLVVLLLRNRLNKIMIFFISTIYFIYAAVHSNRILLILPIMLILTMPQLIKNRNLWLKIYILTTLIHVLYYPLYGVALCFGFLPFGIYQFCTYLKSEEFKKEIKTVKFWLNWIICSIPVILSFPLVYHTYLHIKVMSKQSIFADGLNRFCHLIPNTFFPFLSQYPLFKSLFVSIVTFILTALFIWVLYAFALSLLNKNEEEKKENIKNFILVISLPIFMLFTLSYGIIRLDTDSIFVRNTGGMFACSVLLLIFFFSIHFKENKKHMACLFAFLVIITALSFKWGFFIDENKIQKFKHISSEEYLFVENDKEFKSGTGFIPYFFKDFLFSSAPTVKEGSEGYFAKQLFFTYYLFDLKGFAALETYSIKSYPVVQETVNILKKHDVIVGTNKIMADFDTYESSLCNFNPLTNYYLYHWLLTSGYYLWDYDEKVFLYNRDNLPKEEVLEHNKDIYLAPKSYNVGLYPNSFGLSMKSLRHIFSTPDIKYNIEQTDLEQKIIFENEIDGDSADFLYLEFDEVSENYEWFLQDYEYIIRIEGEKFLAKYFGLKRFNENLLVRIEWEGNDIYAKMGEGKLLIPLGSANKWLLNNHKEINISVYDYAQFISLPPIKKIEFLKLRELE